MSNEKKVFAPTVHLNGSGRASLLDGYREACDALAKALVALCETQPHPRDYYVQDGGGETYRAARKQHQERVARLQQLSEELKCLYWAVVEQG